VALRAQAVHVHVRYSGDWDELYFRDYLMSHTDTAAEYAKLKLGLRDKHLYDRDETLRQRTVHTKIYAIARAEFSLQVFPDVK
jgi:GrpB-like predicted nucleotidyltransferase (UPF0157 family)